MMATKYERYAPGPQCCLGGGDDCRCKCHRWVPRSHSITLTNAIAQVLASRYPAPTQTEQTVSEDHN